MASTNVYYKMSPKNVTTTTTHAVVTFFFFFLLDWVTYVFITQFETL